MAWAAALVEEGGGGTGGHLGLFGAVWGGQDDADGGWRRSQTQRIKKLAGGSSMRGGRLTRVSNAGVACCRSCTVQYVQYMQYTCRCATVQVRLLGSITRPK